MFASLHFSDLPLHCLFPGKFDPGVMETHPAALLSEGEREKSKITVANFEARKLGISPGLPTTRAVARCPELILLNRDEDSEKSAHREALAFVDSLASDFEVIAPGTFILDLSTILWADQRSWIRDTLTAAAYLTLPLQLATGATPDLAHLTALSPEASATFHPFRKPRIIIPNGPFSPLPLLLEELTRCGKLSPSQNEVLHLWGLQNLDDLAKLPRQGLTERMGKEIALLHDTLHGKCERLLALHRPKESFQAEHHFEPVIDNHEPVLFVAKRLLQALCNRLRSHQRATKEIRFTMGFENGAAHSRILMMSEPTLNAGILLRSLHTHLESFNAPAPISEFFLELIPIMGSHAQHRLFHRGLKDPNQFSDTLMRLTSIVGVNRIGIPQVIDSHQPDSFQLHEIRPDFKIPLFEKDPDELFRTNLPLKRQRPPLAVNIVSEKHGCHQHPLAILTGPYQGQVQRCKGPFTSSGVWWENGWQRAEWDIELDDHQLLQIAFTPPGTWEITGIYG